jgi:hypothetical protein
MSKDDPFAAYRPLLLHRVTEAVAAQPFNHAAVLQQQLERYSEAAAPPDVLLAPSLCLLIAAAFGSTGEAALQPATALLLLGLMAEVMLDLQPEPGVAGSQLATLWGMPRALNAGDAFYVLAQKALLRRAPGLAPEARGDALVLLDRAARNTSEALARAGALSTRARRVLVQRTLLPVALALGGLAGGAGASSRQALFAAGEVLGEIDGDASSAVVAAVDGPVREPLLRAAGYIAEVARW